MIGLRTFAVAAALVLAGCDAGAPTGTSQVTGVAASDAQFVQQMVLNHREAVVLASAALDPTRAAPLPIQRLAQRIEFEDNLEIGQMSRWLRQWQVPSPVASASPSRPESNQAWLAAMMNNRREALAAAAELQRTSQNPQVLDLAAAIERRLRAELKALRSAAQVAATADSPGQ